MARCHCGKQAIFNVHGEKNGRFCIEHRSPEMVDVRNKKCELCKKRPNYNIHGEKKGRFCADHKTSEMVDVMDNRTCKQCKKRAAYNVHGEKKGRFCADHKTPEMVDVISKTCEQCKKRATFNVRGEKKGRFCLDHKTPEMVDVVNKKCELCEKRPQYNIHGETSARFCADHRIAEMVDVRHKTCEICEKRPHYNIRGEVKGRFCADHKTQGMVDVMSKKCELCEKLPCYNIRGEAKGRFCVEHKTQEMVNVVDKICEADGCYITACYGHLGKGKSNCASHKQKGMLLYPNRQCETAHCRQLGTHKSTGMRYCEVHMPIGAENLGMETCASCGLDDILTDGKCGACDPSAFQIRQHIKENRIKDLFTIAGFTFVHDRMLESTQCGRERPDFQFDCGTHFVYVEVDEHQHQSYACECEQGRMINMVHVRGMPVRWIRYNPDIYEPMEGQQVKQEQREKRLLEYTKWAMKNSPNTISNVLYLFYDGYDTKSQEWHTLL